MSYVGFDYFSGLLVSEIKLSPYMEQGQVYDYAASSFDAYPAVVVTPSDLQAEFADTQRNKDHFRFTILCFMDRRNQESQAESTMRGLVDDLIQRINANPTLNNNVNTFTKPITAKWGYMTAPDVDMRSCSLSLEIEVGQ